MKRLFVTCLIWLAFCTASRSLTSSKIFTVVFEGDSLTYQLISYSYGYFGSTSGIIDAQLPRSMDRVFTSNVIGVNMAVTGTRMSATSLTSGYLAYPARAALIDAFIPSAYPGSVAVTGRAESRSQRKYILCVMIGTNPGNSSGTDSNYTQAAADLSSYIQARVTAGYSGVVVCTIPDRGDNIIASFDTYRQGLNAAIRAWNNSTFGVPFTCADFGDTSTTFGATAAYNNATYFNADKIHPLAAAWALPEGQARFNTALNSVISQL